MNVHYIQLDAADAFSFMEALAEQQDIAIVHSETIDAFERKSRLYPPDFIILNVEQDGTERVSDALAKLHRISLAPVILMANDDEGILECFTMNDTVLGVLPPTKRGYEKLCRLLAVAELVGFDPII